MQTGCNSDPSNLPKSIKLVQKVWLIQS